jgi:hypothetical protein
MSIKTGLRRLAQVIKVFGALLGGFGVFIGVASAMSDGGADGDFWVFSIGGGIVFAIFWAASWVVDGFSKE